MERSLPAAEFYDYEAKYEDENSKLTIPADMDAELAEKVKEYRGSGV